MDIDKVKVKLHDLFCEEASIVLYESDKDSVATAELIQILKIGRIVFFEYKDMGAELRDEPIVVNARYEGPDYNEDDYVMNRSVVPSGNVVRVCIFPVAGYSWNDDERKLVGEFLLIISTLKSRIRMKDFVEYATFHERELGFFNSFYLVKTLSMIQKLDRLSDYSVIFFNLVNVSGINSMIGRSEADVMIKKFGAMLSEILEQPECLCRMGGDNFVIVARHQHVDSLLRLLKGTDMTGDTSFWETIRMSAYCGVYHCSGKEGSFSECIDYAQASMLIAKNTNHANVQFYDESMVRMVNNTKKIESRFKDAIVKKEFVAYYQPKVNLENNMLIGAEALCRWHRGKKILAPDSFIQVLEKSNRICSLDFYMLETVCKDLASWMDKGMTPVRISTNFSRKHLSNPNFVSDVINIVDEYKIPRSLIVIEVTETTTESDLIRLSECVRDFRKAGFDVSVDDFGVGYSSMSMIKDVPFSEIKIDRSFISSDSISDRDMIMMKHVITMAEDLGMNTIAEGVETKEQIEILKKYGCLRAQGHYFDKPLSKEDFEKVLNNPDYSSRG
ncbi:MAG: GGDEF domain-containing protein [Lachnospiraceae bacterium]|nr:GGDEF domain-containing protein [Lachnospiraceae bacterium]